MAADGSPSLVAPDVPGAHRYVDRDPFWGNLRLPGLGRRGLPLGPGPLERLPRPRPATPGDRRRRRGRLRGLRAGRGLVGGCQRPRWNRPGFLLRAAEPHSPACRRLRRHERLLLGRHRASIGRRVAGRLRALPARAPAAGQALTSAVDPVWLRSSAGGPSPVRRPRRAGYDESLGDD